MTHQCHKEANWTQTRRSCFEAPATYIKDKAFPGESSAMANFERAEIGNEHGREGERGAGSMRPALFLSQTEVEPAHLGGVKSERGEHD